MSFNFKCLSDKLCDLFPTENNRDLDNIIWIVSYSSIIYPVVAYTDINMVTKFEIDKPVITHYDFYCHDDNLYDLTGFVQFRDYYGYKLPVPVSSGEKLIVGFISSAKYFNVHSVEMIDDDL